MPNPKILYNNHFRKARLGSDGTEYATCAEAVADPDDPYKVRGDIIPADDIPNLSDLEGSGIVFDATKNEYRITDSEAVMRRLAALDLVPEQQDIRATLVVGSYLYAAVYNIPGVILKIDITTDPTVLVDYIILDETEIQPASLAVDAGATSLFVGCYQGPGRIVRINLAAFEITGVVALQTGESNIGSLVAEGNYLYCGCQVSPGRIARIQISSFTQSGNTIELATGENSLSALSVYGQYLYCGCLVSPSRIARVNLDTFLQDGTTVTLGTNENDLRELTNDGTYIYCACANGGTDGRIARILISTFLQNGTTVILGAGELYPSSLAHDGTYLYIGCNTTPGKIARILISTFLQNGTTVTLGTNEDDVQGLSIYGGYLFCGCHAVPARLARINISTFLQDGTTLVFDTGELDIYALEISGQYLFAGLLMSPSKVARITLPTLQRLDVLTLAAGENGIRALLAGGDYLYCGLATSPAKIARIQISSFTQSGTTVTLAAGENACYALATSGDYLFAGLSIATQSKVARIRISTFLQDGTTVTLASGEENLRALVASGDFLYCGLYTATQGKVARIKISTFLQDGTTVTLASGEELITDLAISGDYLFCALRTTPGKVARIKISTFLQDGTTVTLAVGENLTERLAILGDFLFCALSVTPLRKIARIDIRNGAFTQSGVTLTLDVSDDSIFAFLSHGNYLYAGQAHDPGRVLKVDPYQNFSLFTRLQDVDVGDSFAVKAGLTCKQANPLRPIHYAADTHLSPVAIGLENIAHSIRAHAPNLVEGGGFESGAFGDWGAGANWSIDDTNELEGLYSAAWDTAADNNLTRAITGILDTRKTYRCIFKAKTLTGAPGAGVLTVQVKEAASGDNVDADVTGYQPTITTTPTWFEFDVTPDFDTENAEIRFVPALAQKGSATALIVDEVYFYEKQTINSLIVENHDWYGKGNIIVNAWRVSPFRSTATSDANNKTQLASFSVNDRRAIDQALTSTVYPIIEIILPAVSGWTPQMGEIYVGDYWQPDFNPEAPFDPLEIDESKLRRLKIRFTALDYAYRYSTIRDVYEKLAAGEPVWWKYEDDRPLQMETAMTRYRSPHNPTLVNMEMDLKERL